MKYLIVNKGGSFYKAGPNFYNTSLLGTNRVGDELIAIPDEHAQHVFGIAINGYNLLFGYQQKLYDTEQEARAALDKMLGEDGSEDDAILKSVASMGFFAREGDNSSLEKAASSFRKQIFDGKPPKGRP